MAKRGLGGLDLNLLVALNAVLEERSVTRAARRMGVSQPAASAALGRLRRHFGDELIRRTGQRHTLTPLGTELLPRTVEALRGVRLVFEDTRQFDPRQACHEVTLMMSDYMTWLLGPPISSLMSDQAPGVRLRLLQHEPGTVSNIADVLRQVDGVFLPHGYVSDFPCVDLFDETWVALVSADSDVVGDVLTLEKAAELAWVASIHGREGAVPAVRQLREAGIEPRVEVVVEAFAAIAPLIGGTSRVALVPARMAPSLTRSANVRVTPCAWSVSPMRMAMWWHPTRENEPAHAWLREIVAEAGKEVEATTAR